MQQRNVHFLLEGIAPALDVGGPNGAFIGFTVGDLDVMVAHAAKDANDSSDSSRVSVEVTRTVPEEVLAILARREEYLAAKQNPSASRGLDAEQLAWMLNPPALVSEFSFVASEMRTAARRLVQTLRWLLHKTRTFQPIAEERIHWSRDGETWYSAPPHLDPGSGLAGNYDRHTFDRAQAELVQNVLDNADFAEPLARQVLLEAGALLDGNPRAACVLAVAAAEVGMKQFAAQLSRSSEAWLISKVPSPPLHKLMNEYFQHLLASREPEAPSITIPKRVRKTLQDGVEWRNDIVHQGVDPPSTEQLEELLNAVDEFLYTLDWAAGHEWAAMYLPTELQQAGYED